MSFQSVKEINKTKFKTSSTVEITSFDKQNNNQNIR